MLDLKAHAVRRKRSIEVTISGNLPDSCSTARVEDIYPGGSRIYVTDPGAAQIFLEETHRSVSGVCSFRLIPWCATVVIPDATHTKVEIFINNLEMIEIPVKTLEENFIVIAITGASSGCSILPEGAQYLAIYSQIFGPAPYDDCRNWAAVNCSGAS